MSAKIVKIGESARAPMIEGVNLLADAVGATMGPGGRLAALCRNFGPVMMTKDGVTVAREIELQDKYQDAGARLCKQVANRCNDQAGDGTTTATILARSMINSGMKYLAAGGNPVHLKKGMDKAVAEAVKHLEEIRQPITLKNQNQVQSVARISGNDEEVGNFVSQAFLQAGEHGIVSYEEGKTSQTMIEVVDGTQFDKGYISPYFVTDQAKDQCVLDNPLILLWERPITTFQEIVGFLQKVAPLERPILLIADRVDGDALATLILNLLKGVIRVCAVTSPAFGEQRQSLMQDLAALTGGTYFNEAGGYKLENVNPGDLGSARRVVVNKNSTTIVDGAGSNTPELEARIQSIRDQMASTDSKYDADKLQQRLAKLSGGVYIIKMGAHNEVDMREKKFRYEDAVHATRAALEEGIVPGGGSALLSSQCRLKDLKTENEGESMGVKIVAQALEAPIRQIAENAGFSGDTVVGEVQKGMDNHGSIFGFNAATGKYAEDMESEGIVDPAKVCRLALQNASTIASFFLLTEALIVDDPEAKEQPGMGGYGGMM